ncbi:tyrosine-protein kinase receptor [Plakobranchus ocellatus]|uniref:Tyrosine-protein kinase receptor n=1 Tax=Plakobranchus ocellatus TaxID=259542 RepID=A0AAV3ZSI5_9GAST|nr:tyrosine-protein kinase receptor [Plakobranchus ocellatus]
MKIFIVTVKNNNNNNNNNNNKTVLLSLINIALNSLTSPKLFDWILVSGSKGNVGFVSLISLAGDLIKENLYPSLRDPGALAVDWLDDRAYIASENRIYSCPLERDLCVTVVDRLPKPPSDVNIDPINGFLYYVLSGTNFGLYRLDLGQIQHLWSPTGQTSGSRRILTRTVRPELIVEMSDLRTFVIDYSSVHLYMANASEEVMIASFLDGSNRRTFHKNTGLSHFDEVDSLAFFNQSFFWVNTDKIYRDDYDPSTDQFHHNNLLFFNPPYTGINVYHPSTQPTPVPATAPSNVQALFTMDRAVIRWDAPPTLQYQGTGAWSKWTYELELHKGDGVIFRESGLSGRSLNVTNLRPDTVYTLAVRAVSQSGEGPWSEQFIGRTLKADGLSVFMGIKGGKIVLKDISNGSTTNVVNFLSDARDIDWYEDIVLWVTDQGRLSVYNRTSLHKRHLKSPKGEVYCVAYDWIGRKVYWSEPENGVIRRSDLTGIGSDYVRQEAMVRDLAVDAIGGHLYWATFYKIEASRLHGDEHIDIFSVPYFSGRRVISLTLDLESKKVFWYVMSSDSPSVYMADLLSQPGGGRSWTQLGEFESISQKSGLNSFSQRLFWLTERNQLVVGDAHCNYTSSVSFFSNVTAFSVMHPNLHVYPAGLAIHEIQAVPNPIRSEDIRAEGEYSRFNLTWPRAREVTHGTVFYKVSVIAGLENQTVTITQPWREITGLSPYTQMVVSIQPYTYWGFAVATTVSVRSPMSTPTAPLSPDVYITQHKNASTLTQSLAADFHWMTPALTRGVLSHHYVTYWQGDVPERQAVKRRVKVKGTVRRFLLTNLTKSETYQFKVEACTMVGCGPPSETVLRRTDALNPIPTLLIGTQRGLSLLKLHSKMNSTSLLQDVKPDAVTFLAQEDDRLFWLDFRNKLCKNSGDPYEELVSLNGSGVDIAIDWIGRTLYTVESPIPGLSNIMQFNIDRGDFSLLLSRQASVGSIIADPYTSSVLWTEESTAGNNHGSIMAANTDTGLIRPVIEGTQKQAEAANSRTRRSSDSTDVCSCSDAIDVASVLAMSYKQHNGATEVFFVDKASNTIYATDLNGCDCFPVFQQRAGEDFGLPPDLLAVDHKRVTWYNKDQGRLYSVVKDDQQDKRLLTKDISGLQDIIGFGSHLQPLPDSKCLQPGAYNSTVRKIVVKTESIELSLSDPIRPEACREISAPKDRFTVYYRKAKIPKPGAKPEDCQDDRRLCEKAVTYTSHIELKNLEPYTSYLIQVAVSNYYSKDSEVLSEPLLLTTKFGAPSPVRDVYIKRLTPEKIVVRWIPPEKFNGPREDVVYYVQYSTMTSEGNEQNEVMVEESKRSNWTEKALSNLRADHTYFVLVKSCRANRTLCSETTPNSTHTFMTPSNFSVVATTPESITVTWRSPSDNSIFMHQIVVAEIKPGRLDWKLHGILEYTENDRLYREEVTDLTPNTQYALRIRAIYDARPFDEAFFLWPSENKLFTHRTSVFKPSQPQAPTVTHLKSGAYEVTWLEPESNGAPIIQYLLEYRNVKETVWKEAYNGSLERWLVDASHMDEGESYIFRVAAQNSQGQGPFSTNSSVMLAPHRVAESNSSREIIIASVTAIIIFCIFIIIVALFLVTRNRRDKVKPPQLFIRGPDTELATLRELPPHTTIEQNNTLYAISIQCTDEEIAKLPHFSRSQLVLTMYLGGGAFGEVYEGLARNILGDGSGETRCAVKTLRKSASENEKEEFLKEALLMKNFQHEHILGLLGVCLDNDPQFIIMELMEGGDLLSFLRSCRATSTQPVQLLLPDLVKVCVHVARGCKYLEDMHFVHRDLAARNCLVSTKCPKTMTVKIGDFGLARDIYKNDYYRKEGEGLLPVRWMSPESLVDGFFTTQSDIWAFGVLMWEVVTLGQKPYPARNNIEVLHFVRDQGKPERPDNCADDMYALMKECWSFNADDRPSFGSLLERLELFQDKCAAMTDLEIAQLSPTAIDATACNPHFGYHHNRNRHRPLPLTPPSFPLLDPPPGRKGISQLYYSHPWDIPAPYSKPWDPFILSPGVASPSPSAASSRNLELHSNPNSRRSAANIFVFDPPDSPLDSSSLYQIPQASMVTYKHDYCQPSTLLKDQTDDQFITASPSVSRKFSGVSPDPSLSLASHTYNSIETLSTNQPCDTEGNELSSVLARTVKENNSARRNQKNKALKSKSDDNKSVPVNVDNLSCPTCLAETARDLSEHVPYISMKLSRKAYSQDENSNDFDFSTHYSDHKPCSIHGKSRIDAPTAPHSDWTNADDRSKHNLAILKASKLKVGVCEDLSSNASRSSPDEGIWSPSMAANRKMQPTVKNITKLSRSPSGRFYKKVLTRRISQKMLDSTSNSNSKKYDEAGRQKGSISRVAKEDGLGSEGKRAVAVLLRGSRFHYDGAPGGSPSPSPSLGPKCTGTSEKDSVLDSQTKCMSRHSRGRHRLRRPAPLAGHTNIAFIDEAANRDLVHSMSEEDQEEEEEEKEEGEEEEEEEEEVTEEEALARGLFTPSKHTTTGGGSVRMTQSARQKRLNDLLGTSEAPEKLVVDLTKIGKKRHLSVEDSKNNGQYAMSGARSSSRGSAGQAGDDRSRSSSRTGFPAAGDYDRSGYLEPRGAKGGGRYLELKNYAPELRQLRDPYGNPLVSPSGSAFSPVHVTKRGYHPSHGNYTLVSPDEDHADGAQQGSDMCGVEDPAFFSQSQLQQDERYGSRRGFPPNEAIDASQYARTRYSSSDSRGRQSENGSIYCRGAPAYHAQTQQQQAAMLAAAASPTQRKYSDQDLYSSTAPYRQRHPSSTSSTATNDHRYASVECNNNVHSSSNISNNSNTNENVISYSRETSSSRGSSSGSGSGNGGPRNGSSGSYHNYSRPADPRAPAAQNGTYAAALAASCAPNRITSPAKSSHACVDGWTARDLDDVFFDSTDTVSGCPTAADYALYRVPSQSHHSSGSRGQVHPETAPFTMIGFEGNQVSLV